MASVQKRPSPSNGGRLNGEENGFEENEWQLQPAQVEVILEDEVTEEQYECKNCNAILKTHYELLSHRKKKHRNIGLSFQLLFTLERACNKRYILPWALFPLCDG